MDEATKRISSQLRSEAGEEDSPALLRLVEWLELPPESQPFSVDDLVPLADTLVDTALTSPWPARYAWALGKVPRLAAEKIHVMLSRLEEGRIDEELIWQATIALQNAATQQPSPDSLREAEQLVASLYRRITAHAAKTPIASVRREQLDLLLSSEPPNEAL